MTDPSASVGRAAPNLFIRVDGHRQFGLGHLYRCLTVATGLREFGDIEPVFLMLRSSLETGFGGTLSSMGFAHVVVSGSNSYAEDFSLTRDAIERFRPIAIVTDLLTPDVTDGDLLDHPSLQFMPVQEYLERLQDFGVPVISITDEQDDIAIRPDAVIDHSCHFPAIDYDQVSGTKFYLGPNYFPLGRDFDEFTALQKDIPRIAKKVLVMFGGSDPNNFTQRTVRHLARTGDLQITVILGPAVENGIDVAGELVALGVRVARNLPSVSRLMFETDIAVTSGGNTTFEFAALGTPAITLCVRERQNRHSAFFADQGVLVNLGLGYNIEASEVGDTVQSLVMDAERRARMSAAGRKLVDGDGLRHVIDVISVQTGMLRASQG